MSTHNIGFYEEMAKIIFQLSSNIHFICSSGHNIPLGWCVLMSLKNSGFLSFRSVITDEISVAILMMFTCF